jgi:hypothetical protein
MDISNIFLVNCNSLANNFYRFMEKMKYYNNKGKYCSVSGCNEKARIKGLCMKCYLKMRKKVEK